MVTRGLNGHEGPADWWFEAPGRRTYPAIRAGRTPRVAGQGAGDACGGGARTCIQRVVCWSVMAPAGRRRGTQGHLGRYAGMGPIRYTLVESRQHVGPTGWMPRDGVVHANERQHGMLYLAVPTAARAGIFSEPLARQAIVAVDLRLMVFDPTTEEIVQWIP